MLVKVGGYAQALMLPLIAGATLFLRNRDTDRRVAPIFLTDILVWLPRSSRSRSAGFSITTIATNSPSSSAGSSASGRIGGPGSTRAARAAYNVRDGRAGWAGPTPGAAIDVSRAPIRVRFVNTARAGLLGLLGLLVWKDKRVGYEQSIKSLDDDLAMAVYRRALPPRSATTTSCSSPTTTHRCSRRRDGPGRRAGPCRVAGGDRRRLAGRAARRDASVLWRLDDLLVRLTCCPRSRKALLRTIKENLGKLAGRDQPPDDGLAVRGRPGRLAALRRVVKHPLFKGTLVDSDWIYHGCRRPPGEDRPAMTSRRPSRPSAPGPAFAAASSQPPWSASGAPRPTASWRLSATAVGSRRSEWL